MEAYYESDRGIAEYLLFHYGNGEEIFDFEGFNFGNFTKYPTRCIKECYPDSEIDKNSPSLKRALDLGCAVGASTFELCRHHDEVIGIDFSKRFIETANKLREHGQIRCSILVEGHHTKDFVARVDEGLDKDRAKFFVGDACQLDQSLGSFDTIFAGNLIDRLPKPRLFLKSLKNLCNPGGIVILTSPYTWLSEYTEPSDWLNDEGESGKDTFSTLKHELQPDFQLLDQKNIPFILREHRRKFQLTLAHATVWKRVS